MSYYPTPNHNLPVGARTAMLGPAPLPSTPHMHTVPLPPMSPYLPSPPATPRGAAPPGTVYRTPPSTLAHSHALAAHAYPSPPSPPRAPLPGLQLPAVAADPTIRWTGHQLPFVWDVSQPPPALANRNASATNLRMSQATVRLNFGAGIPTLDTTVTNPSGVTVGQVLDAVYHGLQRYIDAQVLPALQSPKLSRMQQYARPHANLRYLHLLEGARVFMGVCVRPNQTLEVFFSTAQR